MKSNATERKSFQTLVNSITVARGDDQRVDDAVTPAAFLPWPTLASQIGRGALESGHITVLVGKAGSGKSTFASHTVKANLKGGAIVVFLMTEEGTDAVSHRIGLNGLSTDERSRLYIVDTSKDLHTASRGLLKVAYDLADRYTPDQLASTPMLVVVDYLQALVPGEDARQMGVVAQWCTSALAAWNPVQLAAFAQLPAQAVSDWWPQVWSGWAPTVLALSQTTKFAGAKKFVHGKSDPFEFTPRLEDGSPAWTPRPGDEALLSSVDYAGGQPIKNMATTILLLTRRSTGASMYFDTSLGRYRLRDRMLCVTFAKRRHVPANPKETIILMYDTSADGSHAVIRDGAAMADKIAHMRYEKALKGEVCSCNTTPCPVANWHWSADPDEPDWFPIQQAFVAAKRSPSLASQLVY